MHSAFLRLNSVPAGKQIGAGAINHNMIYTHNDLNIVEFADAIQDLKQNKWKTVRCVVGGIIMVSLSYSQKYNYFPTRQKKELKNLAHKKGRMIKKFFCKTNTFKK